MYTKKSSSYENYLDMSHDDGFLNVIDLTIHSEMVKWFRVESAICSRRKSLIGQAIILSQLAH